MGLFELAHPFGKFAPTVTVVHKEQIVVPKGGPKLFDIRAGYSLLLADVHRGMTILRQDSFPEFVEQATSPSLTSLRDSK